MKEARCVRYHPDWSYVDVLFHPDFRGGTPKEYPQRRLRGGEALLRALYRPTGCLTEALSTNAEGVWGGTTSEERRATLGLPLLERIAKLETDLRSRFPELLTTDERERAEDNNAA